MHYVRNIKSYFANISIFDYYYYFLLHLHFLACFLLQLTPDLVRGAISREESWLLCTTVGHFKLYWPIVEISPADPKLGSLLYIMASAAVASCSSA